LQLETVHDSPQQLFTDDGLLELPTTLLYMGDVTVITEPVFGACRAHTI
jgi:hypothetical protein